MEECSGLWCLCGPSGAFASTVAKLGRPRCLAGDEDYLARRVGQGETEKKSMATYKQIQHYVRQRYGFLPSTCWIAHVKADHGLTKRITPNRKSRSERQNPCPDRKRPAIEAALHHFAMM